MPTRFHIGAKQLRGALSTYAKRFDFLEIPVSAAAQKPTPAEGKSGSSAAETVRAQPSVATLRKYRKEVPPHFEFSVVAGPHMASLKPGDDFERDVAATCAAIDALQARILLIRTPSSVTPGALWRNRMAALLDRLPRDVTQVAWEPTGVWEVGEAALTAKKWGVVLVVDAARDPVPPGAIAYVRLRALGETRSFGPAALERVAASVGQRRDAYVVLETASALTECKTLRRLAQSVQSTSLGGGGRIIRPRGGIIVRDDEQE